MAFSLSEGIGAIGNFFQFLITNILTLLIVIFFTALFFLVQYAFYRLYKWVLMEGIKILYKLMEGLKGEGVKNMMEKLFG